MPSPGDEGPPLILQADSELANQIQDEIKRKLQEEYSHAGSAETISSILPEYIKVIVCNAKPKSQVISDLNVFLSDEAARFVDWLWTMLADRNPARTHSAFSKKREFSDEDEGMDLDRPRDFGRSEGGVLADDLEVSKDREQPNLKGFRSALQWVARDNSKRDRDREERRRERRDRDKEDRGDRDRERRGDRDRRRRRKDDEKKSKKSDLAPTRFTITDSKGAGFDLPEGNVLNVVPAVDRSLLTQPAVADDTQTKFTITLNKIDAADVPNISHYNTPKPAPAEEPVPWWQAGKGGKGGKGAATTTPPWKQWSSGNMVYTAPGVSAGRGRGAKGGSKGGGKKGMMPTGNMVWQNPSLLTEEQRAAQEAALAKKVNAPLSASILHKGNKVWVNPSLKEKEAEGSMDVDATTPSKAAAPPVQDAPVPPTEAVTPS